MNRLKSKLLIIMLTFFIVSVFCTPYVHAEENESINVTVFVGKTCPHCAELEEFLETIQIENISVQFEYYEVWYNTTNQVLFQKTAKEYGIQAQGVPTMFIGSKNFIGYHTSMNQEIIDTIKEESLSTKQVKTSTNDSSIELPLFGAIDSTTISLPILTALLGFLDGFNPCAFFVLLFLLSMLVYAKSKKRMLIIGLTFVFVSGLVYFLFMSAWLNFFMITKNITIITSIAGIVALVIGIINVKDFFAFKKGISLSISDSHRKTLIQKMKSLLKADSMTSMLFGTVTLAIAANMYELLCTAGFPMIFTKMLVLNDLNPVIYYLYLLGYNVIYVIPLLTIVLIFTHTFGSKKLKKSQGEALKLLSGMMMLTLGSLLVFSPGLLNNVFAAVGTIVSALCLTGIILLMRKMRNKGKKIKDIELE